MKNKKVLPFLSGVLTSALVLGLTTTALAASGTVSFNNVNLQVNSKAVFAQGDELKNDAGRSIPSTITYTDEGGGDTTYVPLAYVSRLLDTQIGWTQSSKTVNLGFVSSRGGGTAVESSSGGLTSLPIHAEGSTADCFTEVAPALPGENERYAGVISPTEYTSQMGYQIAKAVSPTSGKYVSVTVKNYNDYPLLFAMGRQYNQTQEKIYTHIPAGQTVTRTFEINKQDDSPIDPELLIAVSYYDEIKDMHINVECVQFGK